MSTLNQLKNGLSRAWDNVTEGWRELVERAGDALTRFHPRSEGRGLQTREDQIAQRGSRWGLLAAEVRIDDQEVEVCLEAPGMESEDFEIQVIEDTLVVRGEKKVERERREGRYHVTERAYGAFERAVALPVPVDPDGARARYRRGVLQVSLPRLSEARPRRIEVHRR